MDILDTQQERRHKLVHRDAANAATKHITQDAHLKIVRKTGSRRNVKQHAMGCEYINIDAIGGQLTVYRTVGARRELRNEFIPVRNGQPSRLTMAFVRTVGEIEHHDVVSSGIFPDEFSEKRPRKWTKQALITLEKATETYMVEVTAEFPC
jgi:hypothetical protein